MKDSDFKFLKIGYLFQVVKIVLLSENSYIKI